MANVTAKTSSNIFYKARCEAATHNEQLSSREGAADYHQFRTTYLLRCRENHLRTTAPCQEMI